MFFIAVRESASLAASLRRLTGAILAMVNRLAELHCIAREIKATTARAYDSLHYPVTYDSLYYPVTYDSLYYPVTYDSLHYPVTYDSLHYPVTYDSLHYPVTYDSLHYPVTYDSLHYPVTYDSLHYPVTYDSLYYPVTYDSLHYPVTYDSLHYPVTYDSLHYPVTYDSLHYPVTYDSLHYPVTYDSLHYQEPKLPGCTSRLDNDLGRSQHRTCLLRELAEPCNFVSWNDTGVSLRMPVNAGKLLKRTIMSKGPVRPRVTPVEDCEIIWNEPLATLVELQQWIEYADHHLTELPVSKLCQEKPPVAALNLDYNHLIDLPSELGHIVSLVSISINCQTSAPRASISKRSHLERLPEDVGRLPKLRMLLLCQNAIVYLPESLAQRSTLSVLDLRLNNLHSFPEPVCRIRSLKQLFLSGNEIGEIPEEVGELVKLEVFRIANNRLFRLPDSIGHLKRLRTLSLRCNQLQRLPKAITGLSQLSNPHMDTEGQGLDGLLLADNPWEYPPAAVVTRGPQHVFDYLRTHDDPVTTKAITVNVAKRGLVELGQMPPGDPADIVTIDARENKLTEIPPEATFLPNLKTLILDRNAITSLPANTLMKMRSLTALSLQDQDETRDDIGYLNVLSIPNEIMVCDNLTELYFGRNHITNLPPSMEHLTRLRVLDLQVNNLREFPANLCKRLVALEFLGLSSNSLEEIPSEISCMTKLKVLRLSKNQLKELPETICSLSNLHTLSVRHNQLLYLPLDLHKLQRLSGHEEFCHIHMRFTAELKVGPNPDLKYPEKNICDDGTAAIFDYLRLLERNPQMKETVMSEIRTLTGSKRTSTNTRLTDRYLLTLAEKLGNSWQKLAIFLEYTVADVDAFVAKYPTDIQLQSHRMLVMWRDRSQQDEAVQVNQLAHALTLVGRQDLAECVPPRADTRQSKLIVGHNNNTAYA
ncbi:hypothetical protein LSAT2_023680 [Lamellibrachia satsuma]|nr:hypothetical protein LSAT2_023680 [Lamellibrachia satsuma]